MFAASQIFTCGWNVTAVKVRCRPPATGGGGVYVILMGGPLLSYG
eukprot:SAG11_NODE_17884_length_506_cov_1.081081_1_plen_44_part_10